MPVHTNGNHIPVKRESEYENKLKGRQDLPERSEKVDFRPPFDPVLRTRSEVKSRTGRERRIAEASFAFHS